MRVFLYIIMPAAAGGLFALFGSALLLRIILRLKQLPPDSTDNSAIKVKGAAAAVAALLIGLALFMVSVCGLLFVDV